MSQVDLTVECGPHKLSGNSTYYPEIAVDEAELDKVYSGTVVRVVVNRADGKRAIGFLSLRKNDQGKILFQLTTKLDGTKEKFTESLGAWKTPVGWVNPATQSATGNHEKAKATSTNDC